MFMVSYQYNGYPNPCGNKTGTLDDVVAYAKANRVNWKSFQFFEIMPAIGLSITQDLKFTDIQL